jgi:hypothetical protein
MTELIQEAIEKAAAEAEAAGLDLPPEDLAKVAYEKMAEDEAAEPKSEEEREGEDEESEEEKKAQLRQIIDEVVSEVAEKAAADATAEDIAEAAAPVIQEKISSLVTAQELREKQSSLAFETEVVKTARDILAQNGFNPDTGKPISKVALAKTAEEAKYAAALELLESRGWPVGWDPQFLARAKEAK